VSGVTKTTDDGTEFTISLALVSSICILLYKLPGFVSSSKFIKVKLEPTPSNCVPYPPPITATYTSSRILLSPVPEEFALHQNYPNPFNPITTIQYDIPYQTDIRLIIFDILGREVVQLVDQTLDAGYHSTIWNGQDSFGLPVSAGVYFFQLQSNDFIKTQKMILLK